MNPHIQTFMEISIPFTTVEGIPFYLATGKDKYMWFWCLNDKQNIVTSPSFPAHKFQALDVWNGNIIVNGEKQEPLIGSMLEQRKYYYIDDKN